MFKTIGPLFHFMACDFCGAEQTVIQFACPDFNSESKDAGVMYPDENGGTANLIFASESYWAACSVCATFVHRNDMKGLLHHATNCFVLRHGKLHPDVLKHLVHTYELFFQHRIHG